MDLGSLFVDIAKQFFVGPVTLGGSKIPVCKTSQQGLKIACFPKPDPQMGNPRLPFLKAIEQNAAKTSKWGMLARKGHRVLQFLECRDPKDNNGNYLGVAVDGAVTLYPTAGTRDSSESRVAYGG